MKTQIQVWNQNTGAEVWTLDAIRNANCTRRKQILSGEGLHKSAQRKTTVMTTDTSKYQLCCHYTSFQLLAMNVDKAIEIFNHDGSQKAKLITQQPSHTPSHSF